MDDHNRILAIEARVDKILEALIAVQKRLDRLEQTNPDMLFQLERQGQRQELLAALVGDITEHDKEPA